MLKKVLFVIVAYIIIVNVYFSENNWKLSTLLSSLTVDSKSFNSADGLRKLIKSTAWTFNGFGRSITFEFDTDSTFKRNTSIPTDGINGTQMGSYKILPARYTGGNKPFYYIEMICEKSIVTSGTTFSCDSHYYLIPDSTLRLYDPTQESAFWSYDDKSTSFKAIDDSGKIIRIEIKENKDINGYKLEDGILWYPNVLDFFPNKNIE